MAPSLRVCLEVTRTEDLPPMGKVFLVVVPHGDQEAVVGVMDNADDAWQEAQRYETASVIPVKGDHPFLQRLDPAIRRKPTPKPSLINAIRGKLNV